MLSVLVRVVMRVMVRAFTHHTRWFGGLCVPFRGGTNRGGGVLNDYAKRIALLCAKVRPWCVPLRTIHDGLVVWEFRFVKVRTGGGVRLNTIFAPYMMVWLCGCFVSWRHEPGRVGVVQSRKVDRIGACHGDALVRAFTHHT